MTLIMLCREMLQAVFYYKKVLTGGLGHSERMQFGLKILKAYYDAYLDAYLALKELL